VDTQGDAFFVAFPTAPGAVAAAMEITSALVPGPIHLRIGLHTGTPLLTAEGYVGADVHRAARIAAAGHGGQVLVSSSTASLLEGVALRDLGEHRFKDLAAAERVYQLGDGDFPVLQSLYRTNLPVPATPFLGRERELTEVTELLQRDDVRLLTLTGPGGTGKTRLALQAAAEAADRFPDGVWWVPLAPLREADLVLDTLAQELGATNDLAAHIGGRSMLALLDNFEHVLEAAGELSQLLATCRGLKLLTTSREPLHLSPEHQYEVPSLTRQEAVDLFLARARAIGVEIEPEPSIEQICRRLDDLPLAVELASARVKVLSPRQILERLEQQAMLLAADTRDVPERQRTLAATIAWSHELLDEAERSLFACLSVFSGGATLEAVEQVSGANIDLLQSLVDRSLIRSTAERYWMLETIREFARDRLGETGRRDDVRRDHADYFLSFAEKIYERFEAGQFDDAGRRTEAMWREHDNFRAALGWFIETRDRERALRMLVPLGSLWLRRDATREGCMWSERVLALPGDAGVRVEARARRAAGELFFFMNQVDRAEQLFLQSRTRFQEEGADEKLAGVADSLGAVAMARGLPEQARRHHEEALAIRRRLGSHDVRRSLHFLGEAERDLGNRDRARALLQESAELSREAKHMVMLAATLHSLGDLELDEGNLDEAVARYRESLDLALKLQSERLIAYCLAGLAGVSAARGDDGLASRLWSAVERIEDESGVELLVYERARYERRLRGIENVSAGGPPPSVDEAVALALSLD
jgi:predicted ATPase